MTSLIRRFPFLADLLSHRAVREPPPATLPASLPAPTPPRASYPELEELRGAAMRRMFPKLYSWCASRRDWTIAHEVYGYLSGAANVADLEQRIRAVEKSRSFTAG